MTDMEDPGKPEEGAWPTTEQWLYALLTAPRERQLEIAAHALRNAEEASQCFMQHHAGAMDYLRTHRCTSTGEAYQRGWQAALDNLTAQLDAKDRRDR